MPTTGLDGKKSGHPKESRTSSHPRSEDSSQKGRNERRSLIKPPTCHHCLFMYCRPESRFQASSVQLLEQEPCAHGGIVRWNWHTATPILVKRVISTNQYSIFTSLMAVVTHCSKLANLLRGDGRPRGL